MHKSIMEQLWQTSHLAGGKLAYIEDLYERYLIEPNAMPEQWREYFDKLPRVEGVSGQDVPHSVIQQQFLNLARQRPSFAPVAATSSVVSSEHERKQIKVLQLINAYRFRGHQHAKLDPLGLMVREQVRSEEHTSELQSRENLVC